MRGRRSAPTFPVLGAFCAFLCLGAPPGLAAQDAAGQIEGSVLDARQDVPLASVPILLLDAAGETVSRTVSDELGAFVFSSVPPGTYRFRIERLGYTTDPSEEVQLGAGERLVLRLPVDPEAVRLEPVEVEVPGGRRRGRDLFEERRRRGEGVFLTPANVLAMERRHVSEVLEDVDGLRTTPMRPRRVEPRYTIQLPDGRYLVSSLGWGCMAVLVDGRVPPRHGISSPQMGRHGSFEQARNDPLNWYVMPDHVEGIEIYRTIGEVPREHLLDAWEGRRPCGLVVVWTTRSWE